MKVLGLNDRKYIAECTHDELEKMTGKYYGKLDRLRVGDELNLAQGYDFTTSISLACKSMQDAMRSFESARDTLLKFASMVAEIPREADPT